MLGQRAELKPKQQRLLVECEALRDRLRSALPDYVEVNALDGDNILNTAIVLKTSLDDLAGVNKWLDVLNEKLGN